MKICNYSINSSQGTQNRLGIIIGDEIIDPNFVLQLHLEKQNFYNAKERAQHSLPNLLSTFLKTANNPIEELKFAIDLFQKYKNQGDLKTKNNSSLIYKLDQTKFSKPLDKIETYRDFYTHEKHVRKGFEKRNEPMPQAWFEIPVYYKGATAGFIGPEEVIPWPSFTEKLDYELELAIVISRDGNTIHAKDAHKHILGFTILNDVSARDIQRKEMSVRLGPSKGKDFCSVIGPVITTFDEFNFTEPNLLMTASVNGKEWSRGQSADAQYSFAEMIEFCSKEEWLLAGDLIGSGTVGTGCGLELDQWIQKGDQLDLYIEQIGHLKNQISN